MYISLGNSDISNDSRLRGMHSPQLHVILVSGRISHASLGYHFRRRLPQGGRRHAWVGDMCVCETWLRSLQSRHRLPQVLIWLQNCRAPRPIIVMVVIRFAIVASATRTSTLLSLSLLIPFPRMSRSSSNARIGDMLQSPSQLMCQP